MGLIYKILARSAWDEALATGCLVGSAVDLADGFIHFSTGAQAQATARLHFAGAADLVLLCVEISGLGDALRWESAREGEMFPHLYRALAVTEVMEARPAPPRPDGSVDLGDLTR